MSKIDDLDKKILSILKEDGRKSYTEIARAVGLSEGAVRRRVQNLSSSGVIKKFTISLGVEEGVRAITLASVDPTASTSAVSERISNIPRVETVYEITGQYDVAAVLVAPSIDEVNRCVDQIRQLEGVSTTNTMIVLRSWRRP
jgi:DNA-binding Lrp family transcriptional regulator